MSNLIQRVQNIVMTPKTEWPVIAAEPETTGSLFTKYILIVSALGPIAYFLKSTLLGTTVPFVGTFRVGIGAGLSMALLQYVLGLVGIFVFALVINALAPTFGGQKDSVQSLKAAAYGATAAWVGGLAQIIPWIGWLIGLALAIYSIYVLYLGLPHTMKSPVDKSAGYTAVAIICAILLYWVIMAIVGQVAMRGMFGAAGMPSIATSSGSYEPSGGAAALEEWAKNMEKAGKAVEDSAKDNNGAPSGAAIGALVGAAVAGGKGVDALSSDEMKSYLPETLGGLPRTATSASRNNAMGFQVAEASADYSDGAGKNLRLEINDTGGAKGILALASWANVEEQKEWQGGYEKTYRADGRIVHERWDSGSSNGEYSVIVGDRFSVEISGNAPSVDALKSALASGVNLSGLETVAREAKPAS
jgi:hypothetical protein